MVWLILIFILLFALAIKFLNRLDTNNLFKAKPLLTENEKEFFDRLVLALPNYYVFPQVALGAILEPNAKKSSRKFWSARAKFSQKIADYIICNKEMMIVGIVELDDKTHNKSKDKKRDVMLEQAGYKILRWESKSKPNIAEIRNSFEIIEG